MRAEIYMASLDFRGNTVKLSEWNYLPKQSFGARRLSLAYAFMQPTSRIPWVGMSANLQGINCLQQTIVTIHPVKILVYRSP